MQDNTRESSEKKCEWVGANEGLKGRWSKASGKSETTVG